MKNKILSALVSIGMVFGLTPVVAFADEPTVELGEPTPVVEEIDEDFFDVPEEEVIDFEIENEQQNENVVTEEETEEQESIPEATEVEPEPEVTEESTPTGNWGQFGYSMNLSPDIADAYFTDTSGMSINDYQQVGNEVLQRVENGSSGFWKYVIYNQWFKYPNKITLDSITPISANTAENKDVDFIMWFQKNANDPQHFYNPGETITYYGGYGTDVGPDYVASSVYSVDAVWAIWTKQNKQYFYDGQPHTPIVNYEYNYTPGTAGNNAVDFFDTVREQLDKTVSVIVTGDAEDEYKEEMSTIPDIISLTHGAQTNVGNYNYKCAVDYYGAVGTEIGDIDNSPSTEAQLTIDPRNVHFTGTVTEKYTGQPITATYTGTEDEYTNAENTKGTVTVETAQNGTGDGLMEGDYVVFTTTATGTNPGTYLADNNNISYKVYNADDEDVTQNYNVTFDFKLIIEGEPVLTIGKMVNIPAGWQSYYDSQNFANDEFTFNVYIPADSNEFKTYTLKSEDTINIPVEAGQTYKVEEVLTEGHYQLVGTALNDNTIQNGVNGVTGTINSPNTTVIITNAWTPNIIPNPVPMPEGPEPEEPSTGSITITKKVVVENKEGYNANQEFTFEVTIGGKTQNVSLKKNESFTVDNLELGTEFSVKEVDIPDNYTVENNDFSGTITEDELNHSFTFVNTYDYTSTTPPGTDEPEPEPDDPNTPPDKPDNPGTPENPDNPSEPDNPDKPDCPDTWIPNNPCPPGGNTSNKSPQTGYEETFNTLPHTGDGNLIWIFALMAGVGVVGLFVARRFE